MKVSCIIPAFNEESTIRDVLKTVRKIKIINEIVVVDDGSTDNTFLNAKSEHVRVVRHKFNRGKGAAIKTGLKRSSGDILLFLDADLQNISHKKIASIIKPLLNCEADFVKTSFSRARGRVTELVIKPLFKVVYPRLKFQQPLSGQFAARRDIMESLEIDDRWGVDVQILIQMVKKKVRIVEVDIGYLEHKKQPIENLVVMSEEVIKAVLSEMGVIAHKHKLIIFDFDRTLIRESSIEVISKAFGFERELRKMRRKYALKKIRDADITFALAKLFRGKTQQDIELACRNINLRRTVMKVVEKLKQRRYKVAIVSLAFSPVVAYFAERAGISKNNILCPVLVADSQGRYTGEVMISVKPDFGCCDKIFCKAKAAKALMQRFNVKREECIAVADGKNDGCLFKACGLSLAYNSKKPVGDVKITRLSELIFYAE